MGKYWSEFPAYQQPSAEMLREQAERSVKAAKKKGQKMEPAIPVTGEDEEICQSWWGRAWCSNLMRYADFASRLERGRRYIRTGTVVDLKIRKGRVEARVQGTRKIPYKVDIRISPFSEEKCQAVMAKCGRKIENMEDLVAGTFPEDLKDLFTEEGGFFPTPAEISCICSCPDWAIMCKHVAAAMYGIGLRLDENPFYFFEMRGIDINRFLDVTVDNKVESMLENADTVTERMLDTGKLDAIFGIF